VAFLCSVILQEVLLKKDNKQNSLQTIGRMSFRPAKALNAIWFSVIMLYSAGKPRLLLSLQCQLIALCTCAADVAYCSKIANELGFLQLRPTLSFDGDFFITISTAVLLQSKQSSATYSLLI
jgi:hypothetical protein